MQLKSIQQNFYNLIKARVLPDEIGDPYFSTLQNTKHLQFVQHVAVSWRALQIGDICKLTTGYIKATANFNSVITQFFNSQNYSAFRREVAFQFLEYIIATSADTLLQQIAEFEMAILKHKMGQKINYTAVWQTEPYTLIDALLNSTYNPAVLIKGNYKITVSSRLRRSIFKVEEPEVGH